MRLGTIVAAAATAAMFGAGAAWAAPTAAMPAGAPVATLTYPVDYGPSPKLQYAVDYGTAPKLELVRGGCGWGAHRTWHGYCHLNYGWRGRVRAHWGWHRW